VYLKAITGQGAERETKNSRERGAFKDSINRLKISELAKL
jgi:hypothetical protein